MDSTPLTPRFQIRIPPSISSFIIVALMMGLVAHSIMVTGQRILPDWQASYLPWFSFLISLESIFSNRMQRDLIIFTPEWILHLISEWVVILVILKIISFINLGNSGFLAEISQWRANFLDAFFSQDYLLGLVVVVFIWVTSRFFANYLFNLEEDYELLDVERNGIAVLDRGAVRQQLMGLIFIIGGFLLFLMAFNRIDIPVFKLELPNFQTRALDAILYFVLGFLLLGLSQYSLLRIRWYLNRIPIQQKNIAGWIISTLVLLALVGLVISFLPTHYSIGLLSILNAIVNVFIMIFAFLGYLLTLPLAWLASLFMRPGQQSPTLPTPNPIVPPNSTQPTPAAPIPWIEWLKSIVFWAILFAVIGYSIYHYLQQRKNLLNELEQYRVWRWLRQIGSWIKSILGGAGRQINQAVQAIIKRIQASSQLNAQPLVDRILNISRLGHREKVLQTYVHMVEWTSDRGIPRLKAETPLEFAEKVKSEIPPTVDDIQSITGEFMEARYSQHEITESRFQVVQKCWEAIKNYVTQSKQN